MFFKWGILAAIVGIICGIIGALFSNSIAYVTSIRQAHPSMILLLPIAGILITFLYSILKVTGQGTDDVIIAAREGSQLSILLVPAIFISTVLTHLCGGSAGREGAALQIGGGLSNKISQILKLNKNDSKIMTRVGMASFFSALFGTPMAATAFGTMMIDVGRVPYSAMFPALCASLISKDVAQALGAHAERYDVTFPIDEPIMMIRVAILALLCALVSILFVRTLHFVYDLFKRFIPNPYIKVFCGGLLIILLTFITNSYDYNGAGMNVIERALLEGKVVSYAFLLKIIFTAITLESGFKGGEVVPSFFIGSTFGCFIAPYLGIEPTVGAALGMIGVFCGATNSFLSSLFLSIEVFGSQGMLYFALVCIICYIFSGYSGLYTNQLIVFSKIDTRRVEASPNKYHTGDIFKND